MPHLRRPIGRCAAVFSAVAVAIFVASCTARRLSPPAAPREDERVTWVRQHAVVVRSIDPRDGDYADLRPMAAMIGDARVLMLSEQRHMDGATFAARARLMRFL